MKPSASATELVAAAQAGDRAAFSQLAAGQRDRLLRRALRRLPSQEDALDAVQETLARAFAALGELRTPEAFPQWLDRICDNACRQIMRRRCRRREVRLEVASSMAAAGGEVGSKQSAQLLAGVGPRHRRVLEQFYLEGLSIAELAQRFGAPQGTIKRWLHEGRVMARRSAEPMAKPVALIFGKHLTERELAAVREAVRDAGLEPRDLPAMPGAAQVVKSTPPELVILGRQGRGPCESFELLAARGTLGLREVPVIMLGPGDEDAVYSAWCAEVSCYLSRPAAREQIATFIRRLREPRAEEAGPAACKGLHGS